MISTSVAFGVAVTALMSLSGAALAATTVGAPYLVATEDTEGRILDVFTFVSGFGPEPGFVKEVLFQGTITQQTGTSGLIGQEIRLETTSGGGAGQETVRFSLAGVTVDEVLTPLDFLEGFPAEPGNIADPSPLVFPLTIVPPIVARAEGDFFGGPFADFRTEPLTTSPNLDLEFRVYYDGPLPRQTFTYDPDLGLDPVSYIEGQVNVTRIEVSTPGGPQVPAFQPLATIPLPASGLLLVGGVAVLSGMRLIRRR